LSSGIVKFFAFLAGYGQGMKIPVSMPRLKGFRFPREIITYDVWAITGLP